MKIKERTSKQLKIKYVYIKMFAIIALIVLLITSIVNYRRVNLFSSIFGGMRYFVMVVYYFAFIVDLILIGYFLYSIKKYDFNESTASIDIQKKYKKIDVPSFICHCVSFIMFILIFMLTPCTVSGKSMEHTLHDSDRLICSNLFYSPKKGDIIVFDSAAYRNNNHELYIKRIIAIEGDQLHYDSKEEILYVNDEIVCINISAAQYVRITGRNEIANFIIPKDKLCVFGDNRDNSLDSREFGLIDKSDVFGRVLFRLFPFKGIEESIIE